MLYITEVAKYTYLLTYLSIGMLYIPSLISHPETTVTAPKINTKGKDKDSRESDKPMTIGPCPIKKFFLDSSSSRKKKGNRSGKAFNVVCERTFRRTNEKMVLQYEFLQFKNLYDQLRTSTQTWKSLTKNMGFRYDPNVKTFTLDNDHRVEIVKVNSICI